MQALGVGRAGRLEDRQEDGEEVALFAAQIGTAERGFDQPRAELSAGEALVQVHPRELGQPFVDGPVEVEDAFGDTARGGDDHDHDDVCLQRQHLDVADRRRRKRWCRHHRQEVGHTRERLGGLAQRIVDLAASAGAIERDGHLDRTALGDDGVGVAPVARVGGDAAGRGVRVRQQTALFEQRQVVAYGRRGNAELVARAQVSGTDGKT